jgi:hydroxypyruvate isomerase
MPKFAANLHYMFNEVPVLERFELAARVGFKAVEAQVPYHWPADVLAQLLDKHDLEMVLIDAKPGNWDAGERGTAALPGRQQEFRRELETTIEYCRALHCDTVHTIAGVLPEGTPRDEAEDVFVDNLRYAAARLGEFGITAVIEAINDGRDIIRGGETYTTYGMRGFFLSQTKDAVRIIDRVGHDNLRLHLDIYHMQLTHGNLAETLRQTIGRVKHIQIASVPNRNEPSFGEINYPYLFDLIDELGYEGWVGCEYKPAGDTIDGLSWARRYGIRNDAGTNAAA